MKKLTFFTMLAVLMISYSTCLPEQETISLTIPLPLSGAMTVFGEIEKRSYEIAAEEINEAGGIKGRRVVVRFADSRNNPDISVSLVRKIVGEQGQPLIFGEYSSSCSSALAEFAEARKIPYLVVSAAADEITQHRYRYVFRLNTPNRYYSSGMIAFLRTVVKPKTIAILHEDSEFGMSGAEDFSKEAEKAGMKIVLTQSYSSGSVDLFGEEFTYVPDIKVDLRDLKAAAPDVIYMISYARDAVQLMRAIRNNEIDARIYAGGGAGFAVPEFILEAGETAEYVVTTALWSPEVSYPGARKFAEKFRERFGGYPSYHGAEAYSALYVVKDALERARSWTPDAIRAAMKSTNIMTTLGPVRFLDKKGYNNQNFLDTIVLQVINGQYEVVWPEKYSWQKYRYPVPKWKDR